MVNRDEKVNEHLLDYVTCRENCQIEHRHKKDRLFPSQRRWCEYSGLTGGTLSNALHQGNFTSETLVALGKGINRKCLEDKKHDLRVNIFELLVVGNKIEEEDLPRVLTDDEHECLRLFRQIPEAVQSTALEVLGAMSSSNRDSESSSQGAVQSEKH